MSVQMDYIHYQPTSDKKLYTNKVINIKLNRITNMEINTIKVGKFSFMQSMLFICWSGNIHYIMFML